MKKKKHQTQRAGTKSSRRPAVKKKPSKPALGRSIAAKSGSKGYRMNAADVDKIARSLGIEKQDFGDHSRLYLDNPSEGRRLTLEIYPDMAIGKRRGTLISVYTPTAHLQLHFCTGYVISEMLGEVTFVGMERGKMSGLIIEKGAACSLYANVDNSLLSGDITQLGPEVMLSGIALSLVEPMVVKAG